MKNKSRIGFLILILFSGLTINSCIKDKVDLPTLATTSVSNITETSAQSGGNITDDGNGEVTSRGIVWSKNQQPTLESNISIGECGTGLGLFTYEMTGLLGNTTYYVRSFASNKAGTAYGNQQEFKTLLIEKPTVNALEATGITKTSAYVGGKITSDGGSSILARGIYWGKVQNPELNGTKVQIGTDTGSFSFQLTNLTLSTTYYIKAYANNSKGESVSAQVSFTTLSDLPTIETNPPTAVASTFCIIGGNVTNNGGSEIIERGVYISLQQGFEINITKVIMDSGEGSYLGTVKGLIPNTTYFSKSFAKNSAGESLGSSVTFTTTNQITDNEGISYGTVKIGTQWWITENLKTSHFNNGDAIPTTTPITLDISSESSPKYQWSYEGDEANIPTYGRLYTYYVVIDPKGICPLGYHIPSQTEWRILENFLGGQSNAGGKLKEMGLDHWKIYNDGATNETGFTGLPGGYRYNNGFAAKGNEGIWYSTTEVIYNTNYGWAYYLSRDNTASSWDDSKFKGYSVRCLRD